MTADIEVHLGSSTSQFLRFSQMHEDAWWPNRRLEEVQRFYVTSFGFADFEKYFKMETIHHEQPMAYEFQNIPNVVLLSSCIINYRCFYGLVGWGMLKSIFLPSALKYTFFRWKVVYKYFLLHVLFASE